MRKRHPAPLPCLALVVLGCGALEVPDEPLYRELTLKQVDFPLKSGLRVLIQEDHSAPLVVVASTYGTGGSSDPEGMSGLAHFVEHLQFRTRPGGEGDPVWEYLKRSGADFNAFTQEEATTYFAMAPKSELETLMRIDAWRLVGELGGVSEQEFATEREVVRSELRQSNETSPWGKIGEQLFRQLFPSSHPLSKGVIGTHQSLSNTTLAAAREFVKKYYRPTNCTMVIAGDVDPRKVQELLGHLPAEALFGPGGASGPAVKRTYISDTPAPEVPPIVTTAIHREKGATVQPALLMGWTAPGGYRGNDAVMDFAADTLNVALFDARRFTKENDDIESAGAGVQHLSGASVFTVEVMLRPGADPEKVRQRVLDSISGAWDDDNAQMMVTEGKWFNGVGLVHQAGDLMNSTLGVAQYLQATGRPSYFKDQLEQVSRVPPGAVRDFAYKWLRRERAATVYVVPESDSAPVVLNGGGKLKPREDSYLPGKNQRFNLATMGPDRIRHVAQPPHVGQVPHFKLSNGLEVFTVRRGQAPIATVELTIPGGDATVRPFGLAGLSKQFVYTKCPDHGRLQPVGGFSMEGTGLLNTTIFSRAFSGNLSNLLAVMGDELRCRELAEEDLVVLQPEIVKARKKNLDRLRNQPAYIARKKLMETLYPEHPYGITEVAPEVIAKLGQADVAGFIRTHYRPEGAFAVVYGEFDEAQVQPLAQKFLGTWPSGGAATAVVPPPPAGPSERKIILVNRPGATQSQINVACRVVPPSPDNVALFDVASAIVSEQMWGLREDLGITYGAGAGLSRRPGPTADLVGGGAITTEKTGVAARVMLETIEKFATEGPDIKMFTVKRWDTAMGFASSFASADAIAGAVSAAKDMGWPLDTWDRYPEQLASATRQSVRELVAPCVNREVIVIVGDAAKVKPQLEAEGLTLAP